MVSCAVQTHMRQGWRAKGTGALQAMPQGGLAYFNCGEHSGASQPHKHTQVVPLPLASVAELEGASARPGSSGRDGPGMEGPCRPTEAGALQPSTIGSPGDTGCSGASADAAAQTARQAGFAGDPATIGPQGREDAGVGDAGPAPQHGEPAQARPECAVGEAAVAPLLQAAADRATRGALAAALEPRAVRSLPFRCFCAALPEQCGHPPYVMKFSSTVSSCQSGWLPFYCKSYESSHGCVVLSDSPCASGGRLAISVATTCGFACSHRRCVNRHLGLTWRHALLPSKRRTCS